MNQNTNEHIIYPGTTLHICLTEKCQLRCKHCYFRDKTYNNELSKEQVENIVNKFFSFREYFHDMYKDIPNPYLNISGGEALLHPDICHITDFLTKKFNFIKFLSNGIIYNKEVCSILLNSNKEILYQISLDGTKHVHDYIRGNGTFDKTVKNIIKMKTDFPNLNITIALNASNLNYNEVIPLTKFVKSIGVNSIYFDRYVNCINMNDIRIMNLEEHKKFITNIINAQNCFSDNDFKVLSVRSLQPKSNYTCRAFIGHQICLANGDRYACTRYQMKTGNWLEDSVEKLAEISLDYYNKYLQIPEECSKCKDRFICRGGMRCLTYAATGKTNIKDIHCTK